MTPLATLLGRHIALATALLAFACQKDGDAVFNNDNLDGAGGSGMSLGGALSSGGDTNAAASSTGGSAAQAGDGSGAKAGGSSAGSGQGGSAGESSAGSGGSSDEGGSAGTVSTAGMAGHAGTKPNPTPEPVTVEITEFEDAYVVSCESEASDTHGTETTIQVDGEPCVYQGLIQPLLDQIPEGALVSKAVLTLYCVNFGTAILASYVQEPWKESSVTWNNRPEAGSDIGGLACEELGPVTVDLTEVLKLWLSGEMPYGIYLRDGASNGIDFASSEAEDADTRPSLSVTYVLPIK